MPWVIEVPTSAGVMLPAIIFWMPGCNSSEPVGLS